MDIGIIDAGEWQKVVDLRTGRTVPVPGNKREDVDSLLGLMTENPYPGDRDLRSVPWTFTLADSLIKMMAPDCIIITVGTLYFSEMATPPGEFDRAGCLSLIMESVERFQRSFDGDVIIAGTGALMEPEGFIECGNLHGISSSKGMGPVFCGFFGLSDEDISYMKTHRGIARFMTKEEALQGWDVAADYRGRFPDYIAVADRGWYFRGFGAGPRPIHKITALDPEIPVVAPEEARTLRDVSRVVEGMLLNNRKTALVVIEGAGLDDIPGSSACKARYDWFTYTGGDDFYEALVMGRDVPNQTYPPGYFYYPEDTLDKPYPFSGPYRELLPPPWKSRGYRTVAAGSRGIYTHAMCGADVSIECFARVLYNYGLLAMIRGA